MKISVKVVLLNSFVTQEQYLGKGRKDRQEVMPVSLE